MREIALDTETTGLDPASGHRIVEIGCVEMFDKCRTGKEFHVYINPERDMPAEAEAIHGLSSVFLADKPKFRDVVKDFIAFIGDAPLVIHNSGFDMKFLNHELRTHGFEILHPSRAVDTLNMARRKFPGSPSSLDALCRRFEIDLSSRVHHGALLDATLLADVYLELCGGRQVAISFAAEAQSSQAKGEVVYQTVSIPKRSFSATADELALHEMLVGKLKNPIWREEVLVA